MSKSRVLTLTLGLAAVAALGSSFVFVPSYAQQPADALVELGMLLNGDPDNVGYQNLRAAALASLGDLDGAVVDFERSVAARPHRANRWLNYGHALKTEKGAGQTFGKGCADVKLIDHTSIHSGD